VPRYFRSSATSPLLVDTMAMTWLRAAFEADRENRR